MSQIRQDRVLRPCRLIALAFGLPCLAAATAHADTVSMKFTGTGKGQNVRINVNGAQQNVFAGQLKHQISSGVGLGADLVGDHITFCTDLHQYVTSTSKTFDIVPLSDVPSVAMGEEKASAIFDIYRYAAGSQLETDATQAFGAAFQIAVWEIVLDYDGSLGRSSISIGDGAFKATKTDGGILSSTIRNHISDLFDAIGSFVGEPRADFTLYGLANGGAQDQIIGTPFVPLPTPGLLGLAGLGAVAGVRRRRPV